MALYNDKVIEYYQNPRNAGVLPEANAVGKAENSACGDMLHLYLYIEDNKVKKSSFKTFGCAAAIAAGSILTEMVIGLDCTSLEQLRKEDVVEALGGLPPMKMHCSVLAEDAIKAALQDFILKS